MAACFELDKSKDGQFGFVVKADAGATLLTSELYKTKGSAENGIASVQNNCGADERYERKDAANGKCHFNLKAANHQVIGSSPMHADAPAREAAIASLKSIGKTATVKDSC